MGLRLMRLVFAVVFVLQLSDIGSALEKYGLQNLCGPSSSAVLEVNGPVFGKSSSGILVPRTILSYNANTDCTVVVKPSLSKYGIVVSVRTLDLRPSRTDTLTITYKDFFDRVQTFQNIYSYRNKDYDPSEYRSYYSSSSISIRFQAGTGVSTMFYDGFELIFTAVSKPSCSSYEFRCNEFRCISKDLRCDGHNHCGDRSDMFNCTVNIGSVVGGVFGVIFLIIAIVCIVICWRRRGRSGVTTTVTTTRPSQPMYPPTVYVPPPPSYQSSTYSGVTSGTTAYAGVTAAPTAYMGSTAGSVNPGFR